MSIRILNTYAIELARLILNAIEIGFCSQYIIIKEEIIANGKANEIVLVAIDLPTSLTVKSVATTTNGKLKAAHVNFIPKISSLDARKKWIISSLNSSGKIYIDQGAARALNEGKSLLPAGIVRVEGAFKKGENVLILDENEKGLARGLSSFTSSEINKIKGKQSKEIENVLGYLSKSEIVHKDDMVKL